MIEWNQRDKLEEEISIKLRLVEIHKKKMKFEKLKKWKNWKYRIIRTF